LSDVSFITYAGMPDLDPDDCLALRELRRRGLSTAAAVWDDSRVDWTRAGLCIIRSTWDYHLRCPAFLKWAREVAVTQRLCNAPGLIEWNSDKTYLLALQASGLPIVPTVVMSSVDRRPLRELMAKHGWSEIVIKPALGLATFGVMAPVGSDRLAAAEKHVSQLLARCDVLVQPFMKSVITIGERALVFISAEYSHAVSKTAFQPLLPAGQAGEVRVEPAADEAALAAAAITALDQYTLYARVDVVRGDAGEPRLLELELIEPSLFFAIEPKAVQRFADAVCNLLNGRT
jgi:hypothetical protein